MWIPLRSAKMNGRILGFQRRVWWPKWTPASRSARIETDGMNGTSCGYFLRSVPAGNRTAVLDGVRHRPGEEWLRVNSASP